MFRLSYKIMLLITILFTVAGILTLFPNSMADYPNIIGIKTLCTFAPAATFYCFFCAGVTCFIRSTFIKDQSGSKLDRFNKHKKSLIILLVILFTSLFFTYKYIGIKTPYLDGSTSASFNK